MTKEELINIFNSDEDILDKLDSLYMFIEEDPKSRMDYLLDNYNKILDIEYNHNEVSFVLYINMLKTLSLITKSEFEKDKRRLNIEKKLIELVGH